MRPSAILNSSDAEAILTNPADVFSPAAALSSWMAVSNGRSRNPAEGQQPNPEARYRSLVEQIPAVVFMANLDQGFGEAYVSPQIEEALGFSRSEWLEDPIRWYQQIHPDDKQRWSIEAAQMLFRESRCDPHTVWSRGMAGSSGSTARRR